MRRSAFGALAVAFSVMLPVTAHAADFNPNGPVEAKYVSTGPYAVSRATTGEACDREGNLCDLFYPAELDARTKAKARDRRFPVVAWANGTGQNAKNYEHFLRHIASWGFVVVSAQDGGSGDGGTTTDAANYLLRQAGSKGSPFYGAVEGTRVGVAGHSQGGASVISLFAHQRGPFTAYVAIHPSPFFFSASCCDLVTGLPAPLPDDLSGGKEGAILYLNSIGDGGADDTRGMYDRTPDSAIKAFGVLTNADHDDVMGAPDCSNVESGRCVTGAYGYMGYGTAWLAWHLQDDPAAPAAFDRTSGEFVAPDDDWTSNSTNVAVGS